MNTKKKHTFKVIQFILTGFFCLMFIEAGGQTPRMPTSLELSKNEPIKYMGGVAPDRNYSDGRLRYAIGVHTYQPLRANRTDPPEGSMVGWTYNHQPCLSSSKVMDRCTENLWKISDPVLLPGPEGSVDEVSVKDPSIVYFEGMWHLFFTARSKTEYTTSYVSAKELAGLQYAQRDELEVIRGESRYGCAPQVFYFEPRDQWYMIFQNRDENYQPAYSTTKTIAKPDTWSKPLPLLFKDTEGKWIDFWIICDDDTAYLFYTQSHNRTVVVRTTPLEEFPNGWGEPKKVLDNIFEAVHIYKVKGKKEYHMIYELNDNEIRSFGFATAQDLKGPWERVTDRYATGDQLVYVGENSPWTEMVSHGEVIRSGYNQKLEYEPDDCNWIIQGVLRDEITDPYPNIPWKLGIISLSKPDH